MIFITHNLGIVARIADRVAIMYGGEIVETSSVSALFDHPVHPYTEALLSSVPRIDRAFQKLSFIPGQVPSIDRMPLGCRYAARCSLKIEICEKQDPDLIPIYDVLDHFVRCWVRGNQACGS